MNFQFSDLRDRVNCRLAAILLLAVWIPSMYADDRHSFNTGKDLESALSDRMSWSSVGAPLADQLIDFQTQANVAILRDRRTDPRQLVSLETKFVTRLQVLKQLSQSVPETSLCRMDQLVCIGPTSVVHRLPMLMSRNREQLNTLLKSLKPEARRRLGLKSDIKWPKVSEPRHILLEQARMVGAAFSNLERIPHDVWDEGHLPDMSIAELATVILNQFDLTFEVSQDSPTLTIVDINPEATLEHRYTVSRDLQSAVKSVWKNRFTGLEVKWSRTSGSVAASLEQHAELHAMLEDILTAGINPEALSSSSLLTRTFQLKSRGATVEQLIEYFQNNGVVIEVIDADAPDTREMLTEFVDLESLTDKLAGREFFQLVFGKHFTRVEVRADRVVLSLK